MYKQIDMPVLSNDDNGVCVSQTPAAGGIQSLTITGALAADGVATAAAAQIVTATWAGSDAARTLTVTFKDADGVEQTGTVAGAAGATASGTFFAKSISSVTIDSNSAGAVEVGFLAANGAVTKSIVTNWKQTPFNLGAYFDLTAGTMTLSGQYTPDLPDPTLRDNTAYAKSYSTSADWQNIDGLTAVTADDQSNIAFPVGAVRFIQTVGSATGTCTATAAQGDY
tara:strand:- start:7397 stop:8071 length:675 start_codon:yes stop_codon:yes gene_type:complete